MQSHLQFKLEIEASSEREPIFITFFNAQREKLDNSLHLTECLLNPNLASSSDVRFERMQFKTSSPAGSKGAKKYVELSVKLICIFEDGTEELVSISISEKFIIRGMSPSYYARQKYADITARPVKKSIKAAKADIVVDRIPVALSLEEEMPDLMKSPESFFGSPTTLNNSPSLYTCFTSPYEVKDFDLPTYTQTSEPESWVSPTTTYAPFSDFDFLMELNENSKFQSLELPNLLI
ncbi:hypothetical protein HDV01_004201 [Terramyces sp. JEL0728]|nr:hypothetical protein HDV01_004201 [Terramyces sp. JEL0728]